MKIENKRGGLVLKTEGKHWLVSLEDRFINVLIYDNAALESKLNIDYEAKPGSVIRFIREDCSWEGEVYIDDHPRISLPDMLENGNAVEVLYWF